MNIKPVILEGSLVRLEPLSESHVPALAHVGLDPNIWEFMLYGDIRTEEDLRGWVLEMLARQARGSDLPFAVIHLPGGAVCGATRYLDIRPEHRSIEIGGTWYGAAYQGSGVNVEAKYLLLRHAFEELGCIRVQLKTDLLNLRSQKAIERLGAVREGVMRSHMILWNGRRRDSVIYSILESEWPAVKQRLEVRLASHDIHPQR